MKKFWFILIVCAVLILTVTASADPARFYNSDRNQAYHSEHLQEHLGSQSCKVSGNYIKIRTTAGGNKVVGHLEQADVFSLDELDGHWARITVLFSAKTSPDSRVGLTGWVDADYVECPCSRDEYYYGPTRTTYSRATITAKTANLRELPSKGSPNHAKISKGEQVDVLSEYTGNKDNKLWYRVRYGKQVGFIREDMLEITETGLTELAPKPSPHAGFEAITPSPRPTGATPETISEPIPTPAVTNDIVVISPDQSLPQPEDASGNSAGRGSQDGDAGLRGLTVADDDMWDILAGSKTKIIFTVNCNTGLSYPISLIQVETQQSVGIMHDDGINGDLQAGDNVFSYSFSIKGNDFGKASYIAKQDSLTSNDVVIRFYEQPSEQNEQKVTDLLSGQQGVSERYVNSDGFVDSAIQDDALTAVADFVRAEYLKGNVSEFDIHDNCVSYREAHTGLSVIYEPAREGELAGADYSPKVLLAQPFANDKHGEDLSPVQYRNIRDFLLNKLSYHATTVADQSVTQETFRQLKSGQILLWNGHGGWTGFPSYNPVLITGQPYEFGYRLGHSDDIVHGRVGVTGGAPARIYVGPGYIEKYCGDLTGCFIWLGSCHSGQNDKLAKSFLDKGAAAVVGYSDTTYQRYDYLLSYLVIDNMSGSEETGYQRVSLRQAMDLAMQHTGPNDFAFWDMPEISFPKPADLGKDRDAAYPIIFGNGNFTLSGPVASTASWQDLYHDYLLGKKYLATANGNNDGWGDPEYIDPFGAYYYADTGFADPLEPGEWAEDPWPIWFALYDMDRNGTPELIGYSGFGEGAGGAVYVYTVENGQMVYVGTAGFREGMVWTYNNNQYPGIVWQSWHQGYHPVSYFELKGAKITESTIASYYEEYVDDPTGETPPIVTLEDRTSDEGLWRLYQGNSRYEFETCSPTGLNEDGWEAFLSLYYATGGCHRVDSVVDNSTLGSSSDSHPENAESVSQDQTSSDNSLDSYYVDGETPSGDPAQIIPVKVYSDTDVYHAGVPITFKADILGGVPPFKVRWSVEESQTRDDPTPLDLYINVNPDYEYWIEYTSNDRHVEFVYTPPVDSTDLFGMFSVTDANNLSSYSPNEDLAVVASPILAGETPSAGGGETDNTFPDVLLDSITYSGNWQDTYLHILRSNEQLIRHHLQQASENEQYNDGKYLYVLFYDLTRDGIPEMFFVRSENTDSYDSLGDLLVYSNDGTQTCCILSIPQFYSPVWVGDYYSLFYDLSQPNLFYVSFFDGSYWQVEYDLSNNLRRGTTLHLVMTDDEENSESFYYVNGIETTQADYEARYIRPDSLSVYLIASTAYRAKESRMDFDAAVRYLTSQSTVSTADGSATYSRTATTAKDKVNVREKTDTKSEKVTQIAKAGTAVTVLTDAYDSSGTIWYFIRLLDGNEGYVRGDLLRIDSQ